LAHRVKKIGIYQSLNEYPSLHIIVSPNERYWKERWTSTDVEEAMKKVRAWLERNTR
jgi:hypothetical protein